MCIQWTHVIFSVVIIWQSNAPISQFNSLCNEFTSVWSMFVYNNKSVIAVWRRCCRYVGKNGLRCCFPFRTCIEITLKLDGLLIRHWLFVNLFRIMFWFAQVGTRDVLLAEQECNVTPSLNLFIKLWNSSPLTRR